MDAALSSKERPGMLELWLFRRLAVCVALALVVLGCSPGAPRDRAGDAEIVVSTSSALSAADVTRVHLTILGPGIAPPIEGDLLPGVGAWRGSFGHIPAGAERVFHAEAIGMGGAVLFRGEARDIVITEGVTAFVALVLQEVWPPLPFQNASPIIDSATASSATVAPGGTVALAVTAHDPNPGDTLSYAWSAPAGSFVGSNGPTPIWTSPAAPGDVSLTVRVTDNHGAVGAISIFIHVVTNSGSGGSSAVTIEFNSWPVVQKVVADPGRIDAGETARVWAVGIDADDLGLTYEWTTSCDGTFARPTEPITDFTLVTAGGDCSLTVTVRDPRGGMNRGTLTIGTGPAPTVTEGGGAASLVGTTLQSATWALPGDVITFTVTTTSDATFTWSAAAGLLGTAASAPRDSRIDWTAPPCAHGLQAAPTVTVSSGGASTSYVFPMAVYCTTTPQTFAFDIDVLAGVSSGRPEASWWTYQPLTPWNPALGTLKMARIANDTTWSWRDGSTFGFTPPVDHYQMPITFLGIPWSHYRAFEVEPNTTRSASFVDYLDIAAADVSTWLGPPTFYQASIADHFDHHLTSTTTITLIYEP